MDNGSYYMDQQLKQYKAAITEAFRQFQLDDDARIAAAHAVVNSAIGDYKSKSSEQEKDYMRAVIRGMLSMAAACHLVSFDEVKEFKKAAEIDMIEIPFKMLF